MSHRFLRTLKAINTAAPTAAMRPPHDNRLSSGHRLGCWICKYTPNPIKPAEPKIHQLKRMIVSRLKNDSARQGDELATNDKINSREDFEGFIFNSLNLFDFSDYYKNLGRLQFQITSRVLKESSQQSLKSSMYPQVLSKTGSSSQSQNLISKEKTNE